MELSGLRALGLTARAERVYLELVERGDTDRSALAARVGATGLADAIDQLVRLGLVEPHPTAVIPAPPVLALEALAQRLAGEAAVARRSAQQIGHLWERAAGRQTYLELIPSPTAARAVLDRVQADAGERVRAMTVGNLASDHHTIVAGLFEALARGVQYQVIYGTPVLRDPDAMRMVQACADAGEQARVVPEVPMNLTVVDDRWALLAARTSVAGQPSVAAFVVHDSPLLAGLIGVFEVFWRMAVPLSGGGDAEPQTPDTRRLLSYLSAGLTDESIARELGVSERTVARRISRLQEQLGARTRFQLGVQASRQGWL